MIMTDRESVLYYEQELKENMIRLTKGGIAQNDALMLAKRAVSEIDWSDSVLQHKGLGWIAGQFLRKAGYCFNYYSRTYELVG